MHGVRKQYCPPLVHLMHSAETLYKSVFLEKKNVGKIILLMPQFCGFIIPLNVWAGTDV
jgi:hypothetical protein